MINYVNRMPERKKMAEAGELFKLQIEEMSDMRKKMKKAKEVKEQEVRLCKL